MVRVVGEIEERVKEDVGMIRYDLMRKWQAYRDETGSNIDYMAWLEKGRISIPPIDMDELIHMWAEEQGFETWFHDHETVVDNLGKWMFQALGMDNYED